MIRCKIGNPAITVAAAAALALILSTTKLTAQSQAPTPQSESAAEKDLVRTFYLTNATDTNELNDIQTTLRNVLPKAHIFGASSQFAITLKGSTEDLDTAQRVIAALDRPRKVYRLTYTITDFDADKRTGSQRFVLLATTGQRSNFKHGSRIPIAVGIRTGGSEAPDQSSQVQYVDSGLSIDATITGSPDALNLRSKIEQSNPAEEIPPNSVRTPRFGQTVLEESFQLSPGKPLPLGSFDIPGTARRQEIEVVAEPVR